VREAGGAVVNAVQWDMSDFLKQCVGLYQELGGAKAKTLRKADTPFLELPLSERAPAEGVSGELAPIASKVLMKILYAARMARYDLLRATCYLATRIPKWDVSCDRMLHRLVCYINSSLDLRMTGWVGDDPPALELVLFTDADFAGDGDTHRSTSGVFLCLKGPRTFVPLSAVSKRQSCVSHSTPEAEIVAADHGVRAEALPATPRWEVILGRK
jgi:hypothetical protein